MATHDRSGLRKPEPGTLRKPGAPARTGQTPTGKDRDARKRDEARRQNDAGDEREDADERGLIP